MISTLITKFITVECKKASFRTTLVLFSTLFGKNKEADRNKDSDSEVGIHITNVNKHDLTVFSSEQ